MQAIAAPLPNPARNAAEKENSPLGLTPGLPPQLKAASAARGSALRIRYTGPFDKPGAISEFEVARVFFFRRR